MTQEELKQIDHPSHYNSPTRRCECIEAMVLVFGQEKANIFAQLSEFKYAWRKGLKEGESVDKELRKAEWYQDYVMNHKDPRPRVEVLSTELWTIDEMLEIIEKQFTVSDDELALKATVSAASAADSVSNNKNNK